MAKRKWHEWLGITPGGTIKNVIDPKAGTVPPPVDRGARTLTTGEPVPEDNSHVETKPNGQQKGYIVLSDAERAKGFVRPVRESYVHVGAPGSLGRCGVKTTMGRAIAETYARDPKFYSGTFCCGCGAHFPVGELGEFVWDGTVERVGT